MNGDRDLLLGALAQQLDFIGPDTLAGVLEDWRRERTKPLGEMLRDQGRLTTGQLRALELLVEQHLLAHQGDPPGSLAAVAASTECKSGSDLLRETTAEPPGSSLQSRSPAAEPDATTGPAPTTAAMATSHNGRMRYRILRPHAQGGLGEVFVALDEELNREVALKEIQARHADVAPSRQRFVLEAEITGGLEHPGIVPVYGLGAHPDGRPYYAMRFIRGENLKEAIARFHQNSNAENAENRREDKTGHSSLRHYAAPAVDSASLRHLLRRFIDVCNAVAYAHSRGVIHRDIKPANVMLGRFGETLVVDWGLAKSMGARRASEDLLAADLLRPASGDILDPTQMGRALGTPAYMAPEQAAGRLDQLGPATDIHALGGTLFNILTNRSPVEGTNLHEVLQRAQSGRTGFRAGGVSPLSQSANALRGLTPPAQLRAVCLKAMELEPADRYASALELARDVENWLADEPVSAYREPWTLRARRWMRKHRTLVTSAAAVLVVAALALGCLAALLTFKNSELETAYGLEQQAKTMAQENEKLANDRKQLADERFTLAVDAVKAQVFDIDAKLLHRSGTRDLREALMKSATERLQQLVEKADATADTDHTAIVAHLALGEVYGTNDGRLADSIKQYTIARDLAARRVATDAADRLAQRDLAIAFNKLGHLSLRAGRPAQAREFYQQGLDLSKQAAAVEPSSIPAQRELGIALWSLGDATAQLGQEARALELYNEGLEISKRLAAANPMDRLIQRDLSLSLNRIGDLNTAAGRQAQALDFFHEGLKISRALAAADSADAVAQRDLSVSLNRIGRASLQLERNPEAMDYFTQGLAIRKKLADDDPGDALAQRHLASSLQKLGDVNFQLGHPDKTLELYTQAYPIAKKLAAADETDVQAQTDLFIACWKLADIAKRLGRQREALDWYRQGLVVLQPLHKAGKLHGQFINAVAMVEHEIGTCELVVKLTQEPTWPLVWGWPRF